MVLDVGANVDSRAEHLRQFAVMGHFYAQEVLGISAPRIGLLSIGEEEAQGERPDARGLRRARRPRVSTSSATSRAATSSTASVDVVVCDGFVGNVLLKAAESMAELIVGMMREELLRELAHPAGRLLARPAFLRLQAPHRLHASTVRRRCSASQGGCFIGHGRSNAKAIRNAIRRAVEFGQADLNAKIRDKVAELHAAEDRFAAHAAPGAAT